MFTFRGKVIRVRKKDGPKPKGLKKMAIDRGIYDDEKKVKAVTVYVVTGSVEKACECAEIPKSTFHKWKREPWFNIMVNEVQVERNADTDSKFTEILDLVLAQIKDRVINGEEVVGRDGKISRKAVTARDLALIANINVDKRGSLRKEARDAIVEEVKTVDEDKIVSKLDELKKVFEELATKGKEKAVVKQLKVVE